MEDLRVGEKTGATAVADQVVSSQAEPRRGRAGEVFATFLKLGLTSFGGPIAHLGYFREELVVRQQWLDDRAYADLVALCQFLPGPASSQTGFALGMMRAGWTGAIAAFIGFTLPSALIMLAFAMAAAAVEGPLAGGALHGLKIVAVAIVAQAVWGMARSLCPDQARAGIAVTAVAVLAALPGSIGMIGAILLGAALGLVFCRGAETQPAAPFDVPISRTGAVLALILLFVLLGLLPLLAPQSQTLALIDSFFRAGALVFGGGHVVLPLLDAEVVQSGWISSDAFLAGYGAAQAVPGPLFTFAAYLGAIIPPGGAAGAAMALAAIFLPGFLVLIGVLPFWNRFRSGTTAQALMRGANAAVVGILGAALYSPVFTSAIGDLRDLAVALACFVALVVWKAPPWIVVAFAAAAGVVLALLG
ncbi:chromate efflux transporter [Mangrovicella endophytica]|uniref:chromate efflux transporter n=1 Tax=Mangrovicella endophytica TaxID=2066697 RepID=UPI000C9E4068|nr:chromate efflux transporter [Mangrovicella endophytica]